MTRLRALLLLAAGSALALPLALREAAQELGPPMTCGEWQQLTAEARDRQGQRTAFVALTQATSIPDKHGPYVLGDCSQGVCVVSPGGQCDAGWSWTYDVGPVVGGRRIVEVRAPPYTLVAVRAWANATPGLHWLGSFRDAVDRCLDVTTAQECRQLFGAGSRCWLLGFDTAPDGRQVPRTCMQGRLVALGIGGDQACAPGAGAKPMPCVVDRGAGSELLDLERALDDELED